MRGARIARVMRMIIRVCVFALQSYARSSTLVHQGYRFANVFAVVHEGGTAVFCVGEFKMLAEGVQHSDGSLRMYGLAVADLARLEVHVVCKMLLIVGRTAVHDGRKCCVCRKWAASLQQRSILTWQP
jgi:hypothetical protein